MFLYYPVRFAGEGNDFRYILFFAEKADSRVQGDAVNPCGHFAFSSELGIGFPEVEYHILIEVIERGVRIGI